jgi:hypothetical protein
MIHEETLGEDKGKERRPRCSWRDRFCVMIGCALVMIKV